MLKHPGCKFLCSSVACDAASNMSIILLAYPEGISTLFSSEGLPQNALFFCLVDDLDEFRLNRCRRSPGTTRHLPVVGNGATKGFIQDLGSSATPARACPALAWSLLSVRTMTTGTLTHPLELTSCGAGRLLGCRWAWRAMGSFVLYAHMRLGRHHPTHTSPDTVAGIARLPNRLSTRFVSSFSSHRLQGG